MDMLQRGAAWLEDQRRKFLSAPVQYYSSASVQWHDVDATRAKTEFDLTDNAGAVIRSEVLDFIVAVAELGPGRTTPRVGDYVVDERGRVYEVSEIPVEGAWRWSDPYQNACRIHTRHTNRQPPQRLQRI